MGERSSKLGSWDNVRIWQQPYDPYVAAAKEIPDEGIGFTDYVKAVLGDGADLVSSVAWFGAKGIGADSLANDISEFGKNAVDYWHDSMSEEAQNEAAKDIVRKTEDGSGFMGYEWADPSLHTIGLSGAGSLYGTAISMGGGALATKGISAVLTRYAAPAGRKVLETAVAAGASAGASEATVATAMQAAKKLKLIEKIAIGSGAAGFGLGEGAISGISTTKSVFDNVKSLSHDQLYESERYRTIYDAAEGMEEFERRQYAADTVAWEAGTQAGLESGLVTSLLGAPMGMYFGKILGGAKLSSTLTRAVATGAAGEAGQEFFQSGFEQVFSNIARQEFEPDLDTFEGVLNAALGGALAGALLGGATGPSAVGPAKREIAAENQNKAAAAEQALGGQLRDAGLSAARAGVPEPIVAEVLARVFGQKTGVEEGIIEIMDLENKVRNKEPLPPMPKDRPAPTEVLAPVWTTGTALGSKVQQVTPVKRVDEVRNGHRIKGIFIKEGGGNSQTFIEDEYLFESEEEATKANLADEARKAKEAAAEGQAAERIDKEAPIQTERPEPNQPEITSPKEVQAAPVLDMSVATSKATTTMPIDEVIKLSDPNVSLEKLRANERPYLDNLKKQIQEQGLREPLEIESTAGSEAESYQDEYISNGNHRLAVLQELGVKDIPVRYKEVQAAPVLDVEEDDGPPDIEPASGAELIKATRVALDEGVSSNVDDDRQSIFKVPSENWFDDNEGIHDASIASFKEEAAANGWKLRGQSKDGNKLGYEVNGKKVEVYKTGKGMGWSVAVAPPAADWKKATQKLIDEPGPPLVPDDAVVTPWTDLSVTPVEQATQKKETFADVAAKTRADELRGKMDDGGTLTSAEAEELEPLEGAERVQELRATGKPDDALVANVEEIHNAWQQIRSKDDLNWNATTLPKDEIAASNEQIDKLVAAGDKRAFDLAKDHDHWVNGESIAIKTNDPKFVKSRRQNQWGSVEGGSMLTPMGVSVEVGGISWTVPADTVTPKTPADAARLKRLIDVYNATHDRQVKGSVPAVEAPIEKTPVQAQDETEEKENQDEREKEAQQISLGRNDGGTLEGTSSEDVPGAEGSRDTGRDGIRRGGTDNQRDEFDDGEGSDSGRGVADTEGTVHDTATGAVGVRGRLDSTATAGQDYHLTDDDLSGFGGAKTRARANMAAIRLLKQIEGEGRAATAAEQRTLARYVGWGGLKQIFNKEDKSWSKDYDELKELLTPEEYIAANRSVLNAHFTSPDVIHGIYRGVEGLGVQASKILEPSVGTGNFIGLRPSSLANAKFTAVELDSLTGRMTRLLYPKAKVLVQGFETLETPDNYFDVVIGNPPFGNTRIYDPKRKEASKHSIHNFFFIKSLEVTRPGGVVAMVVSNSLLDSQNNAARTAMAAHGKFLGAIRLPNNAFKENAGTEVTTDIVFLQKRLPGEAPTTITALARDREWLGLDSVPDPLGGDPIPLNSYFADNPDMMIGEMQRAGSMYQADSAALIWDGKGSFAELLNERVDKIVEKHKAAFTNDQSGDTSKLDDAVVKELDPTQIKAKVWGFFVAPDGTIHQRQPDLLGQAVSVDQEVSDTLKDRFLAFIELRDVLRAQLSKEMTDDTDVEANRKKLNKAYDAFKKKYGYVNKTYNRTQFLQDPDYPLVASLEKDYTPKVSEKQAAARGIEPTEEGAGKGAILLRRVREPYQGIKRVNSTHDALIASLAERGKIDQKYIEKIYPEQPFDKVMGELGDLVFENTDGKSWVTRDEYLSENVKAKLIDAQEAAKREPERYKRNVDALQDVQPADTQPENITVKFGTNWVPDKMYEDFVRHLLGNNVEVSIQQYPTTASASVKINAWQVNYVAKTETWGTRDMPADEIINKAMNAKSLVVSDRTPDGPRVNPEKTAAANRKLDAIRREFSSWLFSDTDRRIEAVRLWNDKFNNSVDRTFDGSHLGTDGKGMQVPLRGSSAGINLRPHQKNAVWRFIQTGKALLDHVVGAGKTFVAIAGVMERKRLGLIKKPIFVVPNHLVLQWQNDFLELYPGANILSATNTDFAAPKRRQFLARAATGDYDAIIMAHSSFKFIPVPTEYKNRFIQDQIADYKAAAEIAKAGKRGAVRDIQNHIADLEAQLQAAHDEQGKDTVVNFDELGVDALIVDESHEFKNLRFSTSRGRDVQGLGAGASKPSAKADDMFIKTQFILERNNNKNLMFLTGTPISNSATELYTVQRYMDNQRLKSMGLGQFDSWFSEFAWDESKLELDVSGQRLVAKTRLRNFVNVGPLMDMYREYADVVTRPMINKARAEQGKPPLTPPIKGGRPKEVVIPGTPAQKDYIQIIIARMDALKNGGKPEKGQDNTLRVYTDARKAAIDVRLVNPASPDHPNSKANVVANNVKTLYDKWNAHKGTQLVFLDLGTPKGLHDDTTREILELIALAENGDEKAVDQLEKKYSAEERIDALVDFDLYNDLRDKLIRSGIPAKEIAFIHQAKTDKQKFAMIKKVNSGEIRVLLGSTGKMSTGMNAQKRLVGLHHMDVPYRPSDLEQREGRIIRQGNLLYEGDEELGIAPVEGFEIEIFRYAQESTFDSTLWQMQEDKGIIIESAKSGAIRGEMGDIGGDVSQSDMAAGMKALASGDPRIMEQVRLAHELRVAELERRDWLASKYRMQDHLKKTERFEEEATKAKAVVQRDIDRRVDPPKGEFAGITVNGKKHADKTEGSTELAAQLLQARKMTALARAGADQKIADYRGFPVKVEVGPLDGSLYMMVETGHDVYPTMWAPGAKVTAAGAISRLDNILDKFDGAIERIETRRAETEASRKEALANLNKPFPGEVEFQKKKARHDKLVDELSATQTPAEGPAKEEETLYSRSAGGRPVNEVTLTDTAMIEETGEVVELEENAGSLLRALDRRINNMEMIRECLRS